MRLIVTSVMAEKILSMGLLLPLQIIGTDSMPLPVDAPKLAEELPPRNRHERRRDAARKRRTA